VLTRLGDSAIAAAATQLSNKVAEGRSETGPGSSDMAVYARYSGATNSTVRNNATWDYRRSKQYLQGARQVLDVCLPKTVIAICEQGEPNNDVWVREL